MPIPQSDGVFELMIYMQVFFPEALFAVYIREMPLILSHLPTLFPSEGKSKKKSGESKSSLKKMHFSQVKDRHYSRVIKLCDWAR